MTSGNTLTKICFNFNVFRIILAWNSHFLRRFIFFYTRYVDLVVSNASFNVLFYVCLTPKVQVQHFSLFASLSLFSCFCFEFFFGQFEKWLYFHPQRTGWVVGRWGRTSFNSSCLVTLSVLFFSPLFFSPTKSQF